MHRKRRTWTTAPVQRLTVLGRRRFESCSGVRWSAYCRQPLWMSGVVGQRVHVRQTLQVNAQQYYRIPNYLYLILRVYD